MTCVTCSVNVIAGGDCGCPSTRRVRHEGHEHSTEDQGHETSRPAQHRKPQVLDNDPSSSNVAPKNVHETNVNAYQQYCIFHL